MNDTKKKNTPHLIRIIQDWGNLQPHVRECMVTLMDTAKQTNQLSIPQVSNHPDLAMDVETCRHDRMRSTLLKALRHIPDAFGLRMDRDGWVDIRELAPLINGCLENREALYLDDFIRIVSDLGFGDRVEIVADFIRATYGHSTRSFDPTISAVPMQPVFHGTSNQSAELIDTMGLAPGERRFVQLTTNRDYATEIANSYGDQPIVFEVLAAKALSYSVRFYDSGTHVWQSTPIPANCLRRRAAKVQNSASESTS